MFPKIHTAHWLLQETYMAVQTLCGKECMVYFNSMCALRVQYSCIHLFNYFHSYSRLYVKLSLGYCSCNPSPSFRNPTSCVHFGILSVCFLASAWHVPPHQSGQLCFCLDPTQDSPKGKKINSLNLGKRRLSLWHKTRGNHWMNSQHEGWPVKKISKTSGL